MDLLRSLILLKEESNTSAEVDKFLRKVAADCRPFIDLNLDKRPVYRGISTFGTPPLEEFSKKRAHRTDRKARNSDDRFIFKFNLMVQAVHGDVSDVRAKSVYCTPSFKEADAYGEPAYLFPAGNVKILWSPQISDSTMDDHLITKHFIGHFADILDMDTIRDTDNRSLTDMGFIFADLGEHITTGELLSGSPSARKKFGETISLSSPYNALLKNVPDGAVFDAFVEAAKKTFHSLEYRIGDIASFKDALNQKKPPEIAIIESDGYYAIPVDAFGRLSYEELFARIRGRAA